MSETMKVNRRQVEVNETRLRELWQQELSIVQIATKLRVMEWDVVRAARKLTLPDRRRLTKGAPVPGPEPTQYEIEQRCLEVRATWSEPERDIRKSSRHTKTWRPPVVSTFGKVR